MAPGGPKEGRHDLIYSMHGIYNGNEDQNSSDKNGDLIFLEKLAILLSLGEIGWLIENSYALSIIGIKKEMG